MTDHARDTPPRAPAWRWWTDPVREILSQRRRGALAPMMLVSAVGSVAMGIGLLALPFFLVARGFSLLQIGALYALVALAEVVVQLVIARSPTLLEDRRLALSLLVASALAWPGLLLATSPLAFVAVMGAASVAGAAASPAVRVLLSRVEGAGRSGLSFAASGLLHALGSAVGLVLGGVLLPHGFAVALYGAAVAGLVGVALTVWMLLALPAADAPRLPPQARAVQRDVLRVAARAHDLGLRLDRRPLVTWPAGLASAHALLFGVSLAVYPFYFPWLLLSRGVPLAWVGLVVAASWVAFALAHPLGAYLADRLGRPKPVVAASLLLAALLNALLVVPHAGLVVLTWVLLGIADGVGRPLVSAMLTAATQDVGASFGWLGAAETAARVVGPYAAAAAALAGGIPAAFVLGSVALLLSTLPILLLAPRPTTAPAGGAAPA